MRKRIRNILLRVAVAAYSRSSKATRSSALLLSEDRKSGTVAIAWALTEKDEVVLERIEEKEDILSYFGTVVVVGWHLDFEKLRRLGYYYESIPSVDDMRESAHGGMWQTYIARRISRIRRYYAPDFEIILGEDPDKICSKLEIAKKLTIPGEI